MLPKTPKHLEDIRAAAVLITEITGLLSFEDYHLNPILRSAVERQFEIIGEAVKRISRIEPDIVANISCASEIIAFRNILIHGYDFVDDARVWATIKSDIPELISEVETLLREAGN